MFESVPGGRPLEALEEVEVAEVVPGVDDPAAAGVQGDSRPTRPYEARYGPA